MSSLALFNKVDRDRSGIPKKKICHKQKNCCKFSDITALKNSTKERKPRRKR